MSSRFLAIIPIVQKNRELVNCTTAIVHFFACHSETFVGFYESVQVYFSAVANSLELNSKIRNNVNKRSKVHKYLFWNAVK